MTVETNTVLASNIASEVDAVNDATPKNGIVVSLVPKFDAYARQILEKGGELPPGIYQDCTAFDLDQEQNVVEKRRRFGLPLAATVSKLLVEHAPLSLAARLTDINVRSKYHTAAMVEAARQYFVESKDGTLTSERADWLRARLNEAQDEILPQLDRQTADYALAMTRGEASEERLISSETRHAWSEYLHERLDTIFDQVFAGEVNEPINGEHLRAMTETFARLTGLPILPDENGWGIIYDESVSSFSVNAASKTVRVGLRSKDLTRAHYEKLMVHEIMIHAWRAENGSRTGYPALQSGLPGYTESEEGAGTLMEALWSGENPEKLGREHFRYAALSYASGVYDGKLHTEQETYIFAKQLMDDADVHDDDELARHVMRVFRGMPEGCRMRSNATYLIGKIEMMRYLETMFQKGVAVSTVFDFLQAGKIDISNPEQVELLEEALTRSAMMNREE